MRDPRGLYAQNPLSRTLSVESGKREGILRRRPLQARFGVGIVLLEHDMSRAFRSARFEIAAYRKNTTLSMTNSGMSTANDQPMYPKKLGILTRAPSAMFLTMKLGALPM